MLAGNLRRTSGAWNLRDLFFPVLHSTRALQKPVVIQCKISLSRIFFCCKSRFTRISEWWHFQTTRRTVAKSDIDNAENPFNICLLIELISYQFASRETHEKIISIRYKTRARLNRSKKQFAPTRSGNKPRFTTTSAFNLIELKFIYLPSWNWICARKVGQSVHRNSGS